MVTMRSSAERVSLTLTDGLSQLLAWIAPPNRRSLADAHIHRTHAFGEEPAATSKRQVAQATDGKKRGRRLMRAKMPPARN
jgi:hypothetical protein